MLDDLKEALLPLVGELSERAAGVDDSFLRKSFPAVHKLTHPRSHGLRGPAPRVDGRPLAPTDVGATTSSGGSIAWSAPRRRSSSG